MRVHESSCSTSSIETAVGSEVTAMEGGKEGGDRIALALACPVHILTLSHNRFTPSLHTTFSLILFLESKFDE